jgi:hypothetical protein
VVQTEGYRSHVGLSLSLRQLWRGLRLASRWLRLRWVGAIRPALRKGWRWRPGVPSDVWRA